jgi:tetratricopeptide (TPR) repeat protein
MNGTADTLDLGVDSGVGSRLFREHLNHVIGSRHFVGAPRLARFLTFVVETVLAGQGDQIKESLIAIEVYGRRPDYNPQIDSTVRVEAGRLRARLRQYYETAGQDQPFEIELPKGGYVPVFRKRDRSATHTPPILVPPPDPDSPPPVFNQTGSTSGRTLGRSPAGLLVLTVVVAAAALALGFLSRPDKTAGPAGAGLPGAAAAQRADAADPQAMESYLRAYELLRLPVLKEGVVASVPPTVTESVRLFEEVTRSNPGFAKGWVGLAEANEWIYEIDRNRPPERLIAAKAAALKAVDLDPNLPEAWTILTSVLFFREWDISAAEAAARRAMELNPRETLALLRYVDLLRLQGRPGEAAREAARAAGLQPSVPGLCNAKALLLFESGEWDKALQEAQAAEALNPSKQQMAYTRSLWIQAVAHQRQGRLDRAEAIFRRAMKHQPHDRWSEQSLGYILAITGRKAEAIEIVEELRRQLALGRPRHKAIALVYLGLGQNEEAMAWLERGFIERDSAILFTSLDWRFAPLRSEPRFDALLARIRRTSAPGVVNSTLGLIAASRP